MYNLGKKILFLFCSSLSITILSNNSTVQEKRSLDSHIANSYVQATCGSVIEQKKPSPPQEQNFLQNLFKIPRFEKITLPEQEK